MAINPPETTLRKLFGGAMECLLPAAFVDVSDLRQVPDHQEAFVSRDGGISVVIEVLSFETELSTESGGEGDGSSARHFFDDLAASNGASSSECDFCADLSDSIMPALASYPKAALAGRQTVAKFRGDGPPECVRLYLVNVRLPNVGTDLLITVNVPYPDEAAAASSMASAACFACPAASQELPAAAATGDDGGVPTSCSLSETPAAAAPPATAQTSLPAVAAGGTAGASGAANGDNDGHNAPVSTASTGNAAAADASREVAEGAPVIEQTLSPPAQEEGRGVTGVGTPRELRGATGVTEPLGSGEKDGPLPLEKGGGCEGNGDVGVAALRSLLHSFTILDWSLFC